MVVILKEKILNTQINIIKNKKNLNDEELEIIKYGLESLYLTITKIVIILILSSILNIFKETILIILFYNSIRLFAFGLHAKNSIECLITSITLFIGGPYLAIHININIIIKIILLIINLILIIIYAPADTEKRPLINPNKRKKFKKLSILTSLILSIFTIYNHNNYISNLMLVGYTEATIMILPITYKLFKLPYNNYKNYKSE